MSTKRYEVRVRYEGVSTYFVDADSDEEADELARARYRNGEPEEATGSEHEEIVGVTVVPISTGNADVASKRVGAAHAEDVAAGRAISLEETVGRTVAWVETGTIEEPYGDQPTITFHFTDGTHYLAALYEEEEMLEGEFAFKRIGSRHVEDVIGGRSRCGVCGWIDEADPNDRTVRAWHGDSFGDEVPDAPTSTVESPPKETVQPSPAAPAEDVAAHLAEPRGKR